MERQLFGSNHPWPKQIVKGDICLLHHYEVGTVFGLWEADDAGAMKIVPKAWGGRFPFQVRVKLLTPEAIEIPRDFVTENLSNSVTGRIENVVNQERAAKLLTFVRER
jgi:hypothetical protein